MTTNFGPKCPIPEIVSSHRLHDQLYYPSPKLHIRVLLLGSCPCADYPGIKIKIYPNFVSSHLYAREMVAA